MTQMAWLSSMLGTLGPLASPLKVCKQEESGPALAGSQYASPLAVAGRSASIDSCSAGSTEASDLDPLSPPSASSRRTSTVAQDNIPELVPQRLDLDGRPLNEDGEEGGIDLNPQHVHIDRPEAVQQAQPAGEDVEDGEQEEPQQGRELQSEYSHKLVPKYLDFESWAKFMNFGGEPIHPTTWMVRNVPNTYTQYDMKAELDELGFAGAFDFLYMPVDKSSKASVGYAFVNFIAPSWAARFAAHMQGEGHKFTKYGKNREASVSVAHMQGFVANLAYYESCAIKSAKVARNRPLILGMHIGDILPLPR